MDKLRFVAFIHGTGFTGISGGINISWNPPNIEFHLPFSFIRIGWVYDRNPVVFSFFFPKSGYRFKFRSLGWDIKSLEPLFNQIIVPKKCPMLKAYEHKSMRGDVICPVMEKVKE